MMNRALCAGQHKKSDENRTEDAGGKKEYIANKRGYLYNHANVNTHRKAFKIKVFVSFNVLFWTLIHEITFAYFR
jgi:hypothetical protein